MRLGVVACVFAVGLAGLGAAARAAPGVVVSPANLRAGPGPDYPLVAALAPGTQAEIFGCESGWGWCDVGLDGGLRGWVSGRHLEVIYDGRPAYLSQYGSEIGVPFVGFDVGDYWGRYYRGRPFYGEEARWRGRPYEGRDRGPGPGFRGDRGFAPGRGEAGRGPEPGPGGDRGFAPGRGEAGRGPGPGPGGERGFAPGRGEAGRGPGPGPGGERGFAPGRGEPGHGPGPGPGGERGFAPGRGPGPGPGGGHGPGPAPGGGPGQAHGGQGGGHPDDRGGPGRPPH